MEEVATSLNSWTATFASVQLDIRVPIVKVTLMTAYQILVHEMAHVLTE